jgi:multidrug efflux system membrane fusion protein
VKSSRYWIWIAAFILVLTVIAVVIGAFFYGQKSVTNKVTAASFLVVPQRVSVVNGETVINLDAQTRTQSGIDLDCLAAIDHQSETIAYGTVLDIQPLIDFRTSYLSAQSDLNTAQANLDVSRPNFERYRTLYQSSHSVSLKDLEATQATFLIDQARLNTTTITTQNIQSATLHQYGAQLEHWALDPHSAEFERLLNRQDVLLRVTLASDSRLSPPVQMTFTGNSHQRSSASLVSPTGQSDTVIQGRSFIYLSNAPIATGTNILAYLPIATQIKHGVLIPNSATIWYGGQPWAYVQLQPDHFVRHLISQQSPMQDGFFVANGIRAGQCIVTRGAQLLLSEELRPPANSSSSCKDPECD